MDNTTEKATTNEAKKEMREIINELKKKMNEIDEIINELTKERDDLKKNSNPKKTKKILEQINVPSLELLK